MIPVVNNNSKNATAVFFNKQTVESLFAAVDLFETLEFDPIFIRQHAEQYDEVHFVDKIRNFVTDKFQGMA